MTLEPNSEEVQGGSSNTCFAVLSNADDLGSEEFARNDNADILFDNYLDKIEEVVTQYKDSQAAAKVPAHRGDDLEDAVEVNGCDPICIKGAEGKLACEGDSMPQEQVCDTVPQDPPSTALGGGSQETGGS